LLYAKKNYQDAITAFKTALQKDPNNANVAYFLALSLRDGGRPDLALPIAQELLKRNPANTTLDAFVKTLSPSASVPATSPVKTTKTKAKK
jgi:tetratricopeptide (TPR) repeat protein